MPFCSRFFLLLAASAVILFGQKPVTLDDFLAHHSTPPIEPTWSPDGQSFFYEQEGAVHLYSIGKRKSSEWFRPDDMEKSALPPVHPKEFGWQNRRVSAASYQWFPNSRDLLASVKGDLFVVHANGNFDQLTKTDIDEEDPRLSPDGALLAYRWKANLYVLDLASKKTRQLTRDGTPTLLNGQLDWVYPEELDLGMATWWSPDSKRIAFLQFDVSQEFIYPQIDLTGQRALSEPERYPQAGTPNAQVKLGAISVADGETKWMLLGDKADALLARVAWLPDSSKVAVERFNRVQDRLDLLFCDPLSGTAQVILHESSKTWINVADNLFFLRARPEFLWTSERSGFRHIYRYSNKGELLGQATSGDWEVVAITAIDEEHGRVYYTSSEASPLETQLYSVPVGGGASSRITKEEGSHEVHENEQGSYFVDSYSSLQHPGQTVLASTAGGQFAVLQPPDTKLTEDYLLQPSKIEQLKTPDGTLLYGRLIEPPNMEAGKKYPVIVSVYGGPGVQSVRNHWYGLNWEQVMAARGYLIWQLDNRGTKGRGLAFEAPLYRSLGKQEVADQSFGVQHLIETGMADPARVGIVGFSYGGYMTLRSLLFAPDVFKVGVAGAPVTDWRNYDTIYTERYMGIPEDNASAYDASSNVRHASQLEGKLLIIHNIEDDNVLFQNTMQMVTALELAGKPYVMQLYPQKTHGIGGPLRRSFYEAMTNFFDTQMK